MGAECEVCVRPEWQKFSLLFLKLIQAKTKGKRDNPRYRPYFQGKLSQDIFISLLGLAILRCVFT